MQLFNDMKLLAWLGLTANTTAASLNCTDVLNKVSGLGSLTLINSTTINTSDPSIANLTGLNNEVPFCRVKATLTYGQNYSSQVEVWLPSEASWNTRYMAVGNGGLAGYIQYELMLPLLNTGFAVVSGDSGHTFAESHDGAPVPGEVVPFLTDVDQVTAWLHDSVALNTPPTKALVSQYYAQEPLYSYYYGCSTGGAQGFSLAQYHPDLFDGIYAGSPGNWYSHLILSFLWNYQHSQGDGHIDQETLFLITNATIEACDGLDGVVDGVISDPPKCTFDVETLKCAADSAATDKCLTPAQIATYNAFRTGPVETDTGVSVYPGFDYGSESAWLLQEHDLAVNYSIPIIQNLVFKDLGYNYSEFSFSSADVRKVNETASPLIDAISPNITAFMDHGGKMIVTQGWADPFNAATWPIAHVNDIDNFLVGEGHSQGTVSDFLRLFMIPAGGHCGANPAYPSVPATYHVVDALMAWVDGSQAPDQVKSSNPPDGSNGTRKLCSWPQTAHLVGEAQDEWQAYQCS